MLTEKQPTIDQKLVISDLMDTDLLRDFLIKFSKFSGLRIRLIDERAKTIQTQGETPTFCSFVRSSQQGRSLCDEVGIECGWIPLESGVSQVYKCFCGLSYVVVELASEFEILGRAILGPFRTSETTISQRVLEQGVPKTQVEHALEKVTHRDPEETKRLATFFADIMDIFLFLSAKRLLTSRLHLETIFRAREEIFKDMESQMRSDEDREELERLKLIF